MTYKKQTWVGSEEVPLEKLNHIETGIGGVEQFADLQFEQANMHSTEIAQKLVSLNGSSAMSGPLTISPAGGGIVFKNSNSILNSSSSLKITADYLYSPQLGEISRPLQAWLVGYAGGFPGGPYSMFPIYTGGQEINLNPVVGYTASGASASTKSQNGGLPIENPDGGGWYIIYCTASFVGYGYSGSEPAMRLLFYNSDGSIGQYSQYVSAAPESYSPTTPITTRYSANLFIPWATYLPSGGYIKPEIFLNSNTPQEAQVALCIVAIRQR